MKKNATTGEREIEKELNERAFGHPEAVALKSENPKAYRELLAKVDAAAKAKGDPLEYDEIVAIAKKLRKKK